MLDLSVIILTYNESLHIKRCLECAKQFAKEIYVIDCYSDDGTQEIAANMGAQVIEHEWPGNQATQFNWALENVNVNSKWIMRLDADEYLTDDLISEIKDKIPQLPNNINGIVFKRRHIFLDKWMKHGIYPVKLMRTFRTGHGICEQRLMDEHITLTDGDIIEMDYDFCDHNLNNISWFCNKHVNYAIREAAEMLDIEFNITDHKVNNLSLGEQAIKKREKKHKYARQPLFWRSFAYFLYRYFLKGAWRDGKEGFIFTFIQGWWYRTLVDSKIFEIKRKTGGNPKKIRELLQTEYGISL